MRRLHRTTAPARLTQRESNGMCQPAWIERRGVGSEARRAGPQNLARYAPRTRGDPVDCAKVGGRAPPNSQRVPSTRSAPRAPSTLRQPTTQKERPSEEGNVSIFHLALFETVEGQLGARGTTQKSRATSHCRHERSEFVVRSSATSSQGRRRREEMAHAGHGGANRGRRYSGVGVLSDIVNLAATPKR